VPDGGCELFIVYVLKFGRSGTELLRQELGDSAEIGCWIFLASRGDRPGAVRAEIGLEHRDEFPVPTGLFLDRPPPVAGAVRATWPLVSGHPFAPFGYGFQIPNVSRHDAANLSAIPCCFKNC
jgi:hypothetical protein